MPNLQIRWRARPRYLQPTRPPSRPSSLHKLPNIVNRQPFLLLLHASIGCEIETELRHRLPHAVGADEPFEARTFSDLCGLYGVEKALIAFREGCANRARAGFEYVFVEDPSPEHERNIPRDGGDVVDAILNGWRKGRCRWRTSCIEWFWRFTRNATT